MRLVIIESPYAGDPRSLERNVAYARLALEHSLSLGEAPMASHLLYTQVLDDSDHHDRLMGLEAGWAWMAKADLAAFYIDLGWSPGMMKGLTKARHHRVPTETRTLLTRDLSKLDKSLGDAVRIIRGEPK